MSEKYQNSIINIIRKTNHKEDHDKFNKYMGGNHRQTQITVSGYWYALVLPPLNIFKDMTETTSSVLLTTVDTYSPGSRQIQKGEIPGFGQVKKYIVISQSISGSFSLSFTEYQNHILFQILHLWSSSIQANFGHFSKNNTVPSDYKGAIIIYYMKPTLSNITSYTRNDIENIYYYDGVFPEADPYDAFALDYKSFDKVSISIPFSFDGAPITKECFSLDKAAEMLNNAIF